MSIEIDTVRKILFRGKKQSMRGKSKKILTYYGCGKPGHIRRNCRLSGIVPRPQINMMKKIPIKNKGTSSKVIYDSQQSDNEATAADSDKEFRKYISKAEERI